MKKEKIFVLSILVVGFLLSNSTVNTLSSKALLEEKQNYSYKTNSSDDFAWKWNLTEVVSTESTSTSQDPSLAVDSIGNVHLAWYDWTNYDSSGTDPDIFYKRWDAVTASVLSV